ncbi:Glycosyl transferase family 2 [Paraoerskovia marina]|uniref:4,4'-diaponeurosporenoate glycosyltransferase n=1 Tax=Paraoerskovia marina TaxID=545619 RepID=A0A1H1LZN8_9CELL|nr:glycosyltransferase family A protein [Paraoerskovia marina]SDR79692.1 Glycosyl transferase family 2 [Paraoerskovia marina]
MRSTTTAGGWWQHLVLGDAVRLLALISVVVAAVRWDGIAVALFALVLGAVMVPRAVGAGTAFDVAWCTSLLFAGWAAQLEWYRAVPWLDLAVHLVCTGLVAAMAYRLLARADGPRSRVGALVVTTALGALAAVLWELGEGAGHLLLDDEIGVGYTDTLGDLAVGVLGSMVAGVVLAVRAPGARAEPTADAALPTISVVVPARDDAEALDRCLALLAQQDLAPVEVIVVDNASSDGTADVARRWGAEVVCETTVGIPAAAAAGYDAARGDVIARLDADSRPGRDWVSTAARRLAADPGLEAVTGSGVFHDAPRGTRTAVAFGYLGTYYVLGHLALGHTALWGSCMAFRREAWSAVRHDVVRRDPEVHDDLDLAFRLGPSRRVALVPSWRVGVSVRSLRGRSQRRRRMNRAWRTLRVNWAVTPPWIRWRDRWMRDGGAQPS